MKWLPQEIPWASVFKRRHYLGILAVFYLGCGPVIASPVLPGTGTPNAPSGAATAAQPQAPVITPAGPVLTVEPGKILTLQASSPGADRYEWRLQGEGSIADADSPVVFYTAPETGGTLAVLIVAARNGAGVSPVSSVTIRVRSKASVALDAVGIPAGWMSGGGNPAAFLKLSGGGDCRQGSPCLRFSYQAGGSWGGIYWWPVSCGTSGTAAAWEQVKTGACAIDLRKGTGLGDVLRFAFLARGENGGEVLEFRVGGPDILPSPGRSSGKVTLSKDWQVYSINLEDIDTTRTVGLFLWTATDLANPRGAVFYLQDLRFEGLKR